MNQVPTQKGFLGTSRILCAVEMGEHVIKQVLGVEPANAVGYMLLKKVSLPCIIHVAIALVQWS